MLGDMKFQKITYRLYFAETHVLFSNVAHGPFPTPISFRLDGRTGRFYRVDRRTVGPWESIDGGWRKAPRTMRDAVKFAENYLRQAETQGTLFPRMEG